MTEKRELMHVGLRCNEIEGFVNVEGGEQGLGVAA